MKNKEEQNLIERDRDYLIVKWLICTGYGLVNFISL